MTAHAGLPIVDLAADAATPARRRQIAASVDEALTHRGFLYVTGHGIDAALLARAFATSAAFFSSPRAVKDAHVYADATANFGYQGIEVERLDPGSQPDLKEAFTMRDVLRRAGDAARWPSPEFRDTALALYEAGLAAANRILDILADNLRLAPGFFRQRHRGTNVTLRYLHYPANLATRSSGQLGAGAHTDYGSITLLFQDDVGGLELKDAEGHWRGAPPVPGAAVINTGDLMEHWTNGRYRSTVHRVRPVSGNRDRYSIALFVDPDPEVEVDCFASCITAERPARYARTTAGEHIHRKITATHGA